MLSLRINHQLTNPKVLETMLGLESFVQESFVKESGLDPTLYKLIKIRASQINGCSFCIDMHAKELLKKDEALDRILMLTVWREVPIYTDEEKAVLELTEYVTKISESGVPQQVFDNVHKYYTKQQYINIIMAINTINTWNRLAISTGMFPGCFL